MLPHNNASLGIIQDLTIALIWQRCIAKNFFIQLKERDKNQIITKVTVCKFYLSELKWAAKFIISLRNAKW